MSGFPCGSRVVAQNAVKASVSVGFQSRSRPAARFHSVPGGPFPVGEDRAERRARPERVPHAGDVEVGLGKAGGGVLPDGDDAHLGPADVPRQARPADDRHRLAVGREADPAGVEDLAEFLLAEAGEADPLEEEVALLGEEDREAGQVHALRVGLHLREVGPERGVEDERRRDADLRVEPRVEAEAVPVPAPARLTSFSRAASR